jgi:hypothetical protein
MAKSRKLPPSADDIKRINAEHQAVVAASAGALQHAIDCGEMLKAAKAKVKHGEWEQWLLDNCPDISARTARNYMWCAEKAPALEKAAEQNGTTAADFSIRGMRKLLAKPPAKRAQRARPANAATQLKDLDVDQVFKLLVENFDADYLRTLAERIDKEVAPDVEEETVHERQLEEVV